METITEQYFKPLHGILPTEERVDDAFDDNVKRACIRLHDHVSARAGIMLLKAPCMSHRELDETIEILEQDERNIANKLLPAARKVKRILPHIHAGSLAEQVELEAPFHLLLDLVPKTLELVRDTRWKLMAHRAELTRAAPARTTTSLAQLKDLFAQELSP